jgi:glutathione S-transferase kappa 1
LEALDGVFTSQEIKEIMKKAITPENKKQVVDTTMNSGAFGAPWIVVVNKHGERKAWFGNDRWDQVFYHLGIPYRPVSIIPPEGTKPKL